MPEQQAEVLADQQREVVEERLATHKDMIDIRHDITEVRRDIAELEMRLSRDFKIWTGSLAVGIIAILATIKYFG